MLCFAQCAVVLILMSCARALVEMNGAVRTGACVSSRPHHDCKYEVRVDYRLIDRHRLILSPLVPR